MASASTNKEDKLHETPFFIVYEERIIRNLEIIDRVRKEAGVEIIMAFKANALWRTFNLLKEFGFGFAASSLNELRLGFEELGKRGHTYCLAYRDSDMEQFLEMSSHITFNSLTQWERHKNRLLAWNNDCGAVGRVSPGLRVNPHCSVVSTDIYNPSLPGSRFGVNEYDLKRLPEGIEGLHFHQLCESDSYALEEVLKSFEEQFGHLIPELKWVNMGGGHLMTKEGYDTDHLVKTLLRFRQKYPDVKVILEPGSAFMWRTGDLVVSVMDIVEDSGIKTAIIDGSFTCHMPDTLEMPYKPVVSESLPEGVKSQFRYNLGGNSCLSGDYKKEWFFEKPLEAGDRLTLEDMNHYTNVKTTMFNGLHHPSVILRTRVGEDIVLREFGYDDYKNRMS